MSIVFIDSLIDACHSVGVSAVKLYIKYVNLISLVHLNFVYFHIIVNKKKNKSFGFAHLFIYYTLLGTLFTMSFVVILCQKTEISLLHGEIFFNPLSVCRHTENLLHCLTIKISLGLLHKHTFYIILPLIFFTNSGRVLYKKMHQDFLTNLKMELTFKITIQSSLLPCSPVIIIN